MTASDICLTNLFPADTKKKKLNLKANIHDHYYTIKINAKSRLFHFFLKEIKTTQPLITIAGKCSLSLIGNAQGIYCDEIQSQYYLVINSL